MQLERRKDREKQGKSTKERRKERERKKAGNERMIEEKNRKKERKEGKRDEKVSCKVDATCCAKTHNGNSPVLLLLVSSFDLLALRET